MNGVAADDRVAYALAPFIVALVLRILLGRTQFTQWSLSLSTMWFAINVLLTPYSEGLRNELLSLENHFR